MKEQVLAVSRRFWKAIESSDTDVMESIADPEMMFVHIGGNASLEKEMDMFRNKVFQPTEIVLHGQQANVFGDTAVVLSDVDYGLLLDNKPTTHHFTTTEVFQKQNDAWKLIQFTFTALVF